MNPTVVILGAYFFVGFFVAKQCGAFEGFIEKLQTSSAVLVFPII